MRAGAIFVHFCRGQGLVGAQTVCLDGTKMRAITSRKNIAGTKRLARDLARTEREIGYGAFEKPASREDLTELRNSLIIRTVSSTLCAHARIHAARPFLS